MKGLALLGGIGLLTFVSLDWHEADATPEVAAATHDDAAAFARYQHLYAGASVDDLREARAAIELRLDELTSSYYEEAFRAGKDTTPVTRPTEDGGVLIEGLAADLNEVRVSPDGEVRVVHLPRAGFEEAYALHHEARWLLTIESQLVAAAGGSFGSRPPAADKGDGGRTP